MSSLIQVDAWGSVVLNRGDLDEKLREGVAEKVTSKKLDNLQTSFGKLELSSGVLDTLIRSSEPREYIFFTQDLGGYAKAMLALRIARHGAQDLGLSWRLFEGNPTKMGIGNLGQAATITLGFCVAGAGLLTSIFGFGLCMVPVGVWIMGIGFGWWSSSKSVSPLTPEQKLDARALAITIHACLYETLEELGVSLDEIKVLEAAQTEGISRL